MNAKTQMCKDGIDGYHPVRSFHKLGPEDERVADFFRILCSLSPSLCVYFSLSTVNFHLFCGVRSGCSLYVCMCSDNPAMSFDLSSAVYFVFADVTV